MFRGKLGRAALLVAACASMMSVLPAVASAAPVEAAATCSGTGCDNKDPEVTGCADNAVTLASASTVKGRFELRRSITCNTYWVRFPNYAGGSTRPDGKIQLTVWDVSRDKYAHFFASSARGPHWGNMIYDAPPPCVWGMAHWTNDGSWDVILKGPGC